MKRMHYIFSIVLFLSSFTACGNFLDREEDSFIDLDRTYKSYERTSQVLVNAYRYLPEGFSRIGSSMYDASTDDAENTIETVSIQKFNNGSWNAMDNPDDQWNRLYAGIRIVNEFIENVHKVDLDNYRLDPDNQTEYQNRVKDLRIWKYEAVFLRAFFHFELVKRYGPVPYITSTLEVEGDHGNVTRPDMDSVISLIVEDCDAAAENLDVKPWRNEASAYGRATKGAALALKSRVLLYAASPLYLDWQNLDESYLPSDLKKWEKAAKAARDVIDLNEYTLYGDYAGLFANNISNREFIFQKRYTNSIAFEKYNSPVSYGGTGGTVPSLNLMEAYELKNGKMFSWDDEDSSAHPFTYRDSRLAATFLFNGSIWKGTPVETFEGGKDAPGLTNATKTGFYLRKFMNEDVNVQTGGNSMGHVWPYFRLAEIYLNYAEALNEYDPGNADIAEYLNKVRTRSGQPVINSGLSQEEMREKIHNERRVELAFEEHRAFDVRRWKVAGNTLGDDIRGLKTTVSQVKSGSVTKAGIPQNEIPEGWYYYDGDEFNGSSIDNRYWGLYGADSPVGNQYYGQPTGNIQTYRASQASIVKENGKSFCRLQATRDDNPPAPQQAYGNASRPGWWSAALSSRDTDKYGYPRKLYPLFSRIEVCARVPYIYGVWMGPWCRYYDGASYAELDIEEFFVKTWEGNANPTRLSQALHLHDNDKGSNVSDATLGVNVNGYGRHTILDFDPYQDYHIYGVQVEPDPEDPENHAIISYLLDGQLTNSFKTRDYGDRYNLFVTKAIKDNRQLNCWDVAITAQIGGKDVNGIGYPEDRNADLRNVCMDVDWVRVFTRTNSGGGIPDPDYPEHEGFEYSKTVVEKRVFTPNMYWYPIPQSEILQTGWPQNPLWN